MVLLMQQICHSKIADQGLVQMDSNFKLAVIWLKYGSCYSLMIHCLSRWNREYWSRGGLGRPDCVQKEETQKTCWLCMSNCPATKRGLVKRQESVVPFNTHTSIVLFHKALNFFMSPQRRARGLYYRNIFKKLKVWWTMCVQGNPLLLPRN